MHYFYGICPTCKMTTYRYPTKDFYQHSSDGSTICPA